MLKEGIENLLQLGTIEEAEAGGVRQMLEIPAARLAAKHRTETELVRLDHILEQLRAASIDDPAIAALDIEFHTTIALASGNRVLACLVFALHRATEPVLHLSLTTEVGRESHRQHLRLAKAIRDGDSDAAEAAITDHLSYLEAHPRRLADDLFRPSAGR
jgi:DNA-binding FadR family transcriptional regulator